MWFRTLKNESHFSREKRALYFLTYFFLVAPIVIGPFANADPVGNSAARYPDVWGYEFDYPADDFSLMRVYPAKQGDFLLEYWISAHVSPARPNASVSGDLMRAQRLLFARADVDAPKDVQVCLTYGGPPGCIKEFSSSQPTTFADGSYIKVTEPELTPSQFKGYISLFDRNGVKKKSKLVLYVPKVPVQSSTRIHVDGEMAGIPVAVRQRVRSASDVMVIPLEDETFLLVEKGGGRFVIRFDANLETQFRSPRLAIVDAMLIEGIARKLANRDGEFTAEDGQRIEIGSGVYDPQLLNDLVSDLARAPNKEN